MVPETSTIGDERLLAWTCLLPDDARIATWNVPSTVCALLPEPPSRSANVWFGWQPHVHDLPTPDLLQTLALVNPRGIRPSTLRAMGWSHVHTFAVLPSLAEPRWFLPLQSRPAALRGWDLYTPFRPNAVMSRLLAKTLTAVGGLSAVGDRFVIASREASPLERLLGDVLDSASFRIAIATGTPGTRQKVTLQMMTSAGEVVGYAKVATQPYAISLVRHEATVRDALAACPTEGVSVPSMLYHGAFQHGYVLVSAPAATARRPVLVLTERHDDVLLAMAARHGKSTTGELVGRLQDRIQTLAPTLDDQWRERLLSATRLLAHLPNLFDLPTAFAHGDFTPWNVQIGHRDGQVALIDWEDANDEQFLLWDAFHFITQTALLLEANPTAQRTMEPLARIGSGRLAHALRLDRGQVVGLFLAYLLDASVRWFEEPQPQSVQHLRATVIDLVITLCEPFATSALPRATGASEARSAVATRESVAHGVRTIASARCSSLDMPR